MTAHEDSVYVCADRDIALAREVWTVETLSNGDMVFKSQHGKYLGIDRTTGSVVGTEIAHDEHSQCRIEETDSFNDFVIRIRTH